MTLRLGFCGVGKWARKLAESFRACGAEVVAYDRKTPGPDPTWRCSACEKNPPAAGTECAACGLFYTRRGVPCPGSHWGHRIPWRDQLADKSIDAIVAVAPPEITTAVALACAEAGKAVMATKPLLRTPERTAAPFWVDYWRLWAPAHAHPRELRYDLCGRGPFRSFPGALDYGPHVMAALLDKGEVQLVSAKNIAPGEGDLFDCEFDVEGESVRSIFGNGGVTGVRNIWGWHETPSDIGGHDKDAILAAFCRSFMSAVSDGHDDGSLLRLSREGMRLLREIRERAK